MIVQIWSIPSSYRNAQKCANNDNGDWSSFGGTTCFHRTSAFNGLRMIHGSHGVLYELFRWPAQKAK